MFGTDRCSTKNWYNRKPKKNKYYVWGYVFLSFYSHLWKKSTHIMLYNVIKNYVCMLKVLNSNIMFLNLAYFVHWTHSYIIFICPDYICCILFYIFIDITKPYNGVKEKFILTAIKFFIIFLMVTTPTKLQIVRFVSSCSDNFGNKSLFNIIFFSAAYL